MANALNGALDLVFPGQRTKLWETLNRIKTKQRSDEKTGSRRCDLFWMKRVSLHQDMHCLMHTIFQVKEINKLIH